MNKVLNKILIRIEKTVKGYSLRERAVEYADRIRRRTRLGWGIKDGERGNKRERLKPLSERYKKIRKRTNLSSKTTAGRSNLTRTGKLLDSIKGFARGKKIVFEITENRDDGALNKDIVKGQSEQGRDFFELTDKELKGLRNAIKKDLIKIMKKR